MFWKRSKIRRAVQRALDSDELSAIDALDEKLRGAAYGSLALAYYRDERLGAARGALKRAMAIDPDDVDLHELAVTLATEEGRIDDAITSQRRVVARRPRQPEARAQLAELLIQAGRGAEAIEMLAPLRGKDPATDHRLAEALYLDGQAKLALELLEHVCAHYDAQLRELSAADFQSLRTRADEAHRLRDDIYAELHGREATIELHAKAGKLDARAGVNYRLLGARLAATSAHVPATRRLESPDDTEARARTIDGAAGLVLLGSAQLRRGEVARARKTFEQARELDGGSFGAFFGLGAAIDHETYDLHRRAARFALPPAHVAEVVPDLPALTDAERRVVWASIEPLAGLLPRVAAAGARMRILPIDVRATDVELFREIAGRREGDDQRSYDAISGLATHGGAVAKVEELLDVVTDAGLTFAHELAHLVFFHMPQAQRMPIHRLYAKARRVGYASTGYALSNLDEFFACSYAEYLRVRHDLPGAPIADDAGLRDALNAYFDELSGR